MMQAVREFFLSRSYIEVDTPIRLPVLIPEAEIIPIPSGNSFLQTSPELCMKRLLAQGNSRLFQICHCFRQDEIGSRHQEEFSMLEWYHCGWSYLELMQECEELIAAVADRLTGTLLERNGKTISLASPWQRLTVDNAFRSYTGISADAAVEQGLFDELLVEKVEPALGWQQPVFLYDYPLPLASLARPKKNNPGLAERFELYIGGLELANGFSELTDATVQRLRFAEEIDRAEKNGRQAAMPEKFLQSLARLPECAGIALGLDRLLMLLLARGDIADVLPFAVDDL